MYCGCPLPGKNAGQKLLQLVNQYVKNMPPPFLRPLDQTGSLSATHPSDHNAIYFLHDNDVSESSRKARLDEVRQRRRKDAEKATKSGRSLSRDRKHLPAFLMPIPMFTETAKCSAITGNVIDLQSPTPTAKCRTGEEPKVPPATSTVRNSGRRSQTISSSTSSGAVGGGERGRRSTLAGEWRSGGRKFSTLSTLVGPSGEANPGVGDGAVDGNHEGQNHNGGI